MYFYPDEGQKGMDYDNWPKGKNGRIPNLSRGYVEELAEKLHSANCEATADVEWGCMISFKTWRGNLAPQSTGRWFQRDDQSTGSSIYR